MKGTEIVARDGRNFGPGGGIRAGHWPASRLLIRSFRIRKERSFFPSFGEEERITFFQD